jgi:murein L,D-transpeptidase YcbB/YkuD
MKRTIILSVIAFLVFPLFNIMPQKGDDGSVQDYIRKSINALESSGSLKLDKQKIIGNPIITGLYKNEDYQPVWGHAGNRKDLIEILEESYFEGLQPEDYHIEFIRDHDEKIERGVRISMEEYAAADIIMTNAVLTYAFHLIQGKVHPVELDPTWNYSMRPMPDDVEFRLMNRLNTQTLKEGIAN